MAAVLKKKPKAFNPTKFAAIRSRYKDVLKNHGGEIAEGLFVRMPGNAILEFGWLIEVIETDLLGVEPEDEGDEEAPAA